MKEKVMSDAKHHFYLKSHHNLRCFGFLIKNYYKQVLSTSQSTGNILEQVPSYILNAPPFLLNTAQISLLPELLGSSVYHMSLPMAAPVTQETNKPFKLESM
jgi:hypothetical protein